MQIQNVRHSKNKKLYRKFFKRMFLTIIAGMFLWFIVGWFLGHILMISKDYSDLRAMSVEYEKEVFSSGIIGGEVWLYKTKK
ncbi:MAG: hypothetical protein LBQ37_02640 [Elusimicrobiota bacterium]|jgi:hypothetical protein|nr:hypothetical protein [Elusimicrobiota bacterium]